MHINACNHYRVFFYALFRSTHLLAGNVIVMLLKCKQHKLLYWIIGLESLESYVIPLGLL